MHYSKKIIYSTPHYTFAKKKFYVVSYASKDNTQMVYSYKQNYPDANKPLDLSLKSLPNFMPKIEKKTLVFNEYGKSYEVHLSYNKNIIDFMATYPQANYDTYFNAPLDNTTYKSIVSALKKYVDGMKTGDAINFVLHFVQKSFKYEVDSQQFSREKPMFVYETLFYDKSDCEDRSVLFSYLIKEMFGIGVVGIKYSSHMSTALYVPMFGDSVKVGQKKFIIADPTFVNANIGQSMPKYKLVKPEDFIFVRRD